MKSLTHLPSIAWFQTEPAAPAGDWTSSLFSLAILAAFFGIFYFLIIRPQKKRQRIHQDLIRSLKRGDDVVTAGGICGVIRKVNDENVILESEGGTTLKIQKHSIVERT